MLNGSPRKDVEIHRSHWGRNEKIFEAEGGRKQRLSVSEIKMTEAALPVDAVMNLEKMCFDDVVNELTGKFEAADGLVIASPVYYASANATLIAVLNRLLQFPL